MLFSQTSLVLALATSVSAHMRLKYPVPYGFDTLNSSPLAPADFPCKQRPGVYDVTTMNTWNAGETKEVSFLGSAVHGGGSCQFSITTDAKPDQSSQWKVIQSVVGGCPSNVTGNITPANPDGTEAAVFPVTMPEDIPAGQYTFAWSWMNKIGNREFYMNCAPVQVGSGSGQASTASVESALSALPDMFVANLPATSCSSKEEEDFNYPNPGSNVIVSKGAKPGNTLTGAGCAQMSQVGAGNGQIGTPSPPTGNPEQPAASPPAANPPSYGTPVESGVPSSPGGVFAPGASSAPAVEPPAAQPAPPAAQPTPPAAAPPAAQPAPPVAAPQPIAPEPTYGKGPGDSNGTTPSTPSSDPDCTPCTNDGAVVCIGENQFGLCNRGCAVAQALAAGMSCSAGSVVGTASLSSKRSLKFPRAHLHRRHGSSLL